MFGSFASYLRRHHIGMLALFIALSGTAYAATLPRNSVGTAQLKKNAVTTAKVQNRSLLATDFKSGQLPAGPRGAQGAQGAQGPQGPAGAAGATKVTVREGAAGLRARRPRRATQASGRPEVAGSRTRLPRSSGSRHPLRPSGTPTTWSASAQDTAGIRRKRAGIRHLRGSLSGKVGGRPSARARRVAVESALRATLDAFSRRHGPTL